MKGKRVLVTGSAGVIGIELLKRLISAGAEILSVDRFPIPSGFSEVVTHLQRDLTAAPLYELQNFQPEIIFHLAAAFERSEESPEFWRFNWHDNMLLSHYLIDLAKDIGTVETFIFASSYLIYSPALYMFEALPEQARYLKETDAVEPRNITGAAKYYTEGELEFVRKNQNPSLRTINARIYRVYGCGSKDIISRWIRDALDDRQIELYNKENRFDYIYAGDVAEGLLRLAFSPNASGVVNLGSGTARSVQDVVSILKGHFPRLDVQDIGRHEVVEASCALLGKLKQLTDWTPTMDLEHGIETVIEFERSKKINEQ